MDGRASLRIAYSNKKYVKNIGNIIREIQYDRLGTLKMTSHYDLDKHSGPTQDYNVNRILHLARVANLSLLSPIEQF